MFSYSSTTRQKITQILFDRNRDSNSPLPSMRSLAAQLGISTTTIQKVFHSLVEENKIKKTKGGRHYYRAGVLKTNSPTEEPIPTPSAVPRYVSISDELRKDISQGYFSEKRFLPPLKQLQEKYRCTYRTLRSALTHLVNLGLLNGLGHGKFGLHARKKSRRSTSGLHLIANRALLESMPWNTFSFVDTLENELEQAGWDSLRIENSITPSASLKKASHNSQGIIVFVDSNWSRFIQSSRRVLPYPVCMIDMNWALNKIGNLSSKSSLLLQPDNFYAGNAVGQSLLSDGHKKCSYFSYFDDTHSWAQDRMQGVRSIFSGHQKSSCQSFQNKTNGRIQGSLSSGPKK